MHHLKMVDFPWLVAGQKNPRLAIDMLHAMARAQHQPDALTESLTIRSSIIKGGNWKFYLNGGFHGKIIHNREIVYCHV